ncbi:MAG: hypothetical protein DMG61_09675 [Acidobacteria bacterium]|nr:MAG: hypothetical protein DMG61_09675 [Acidobacteriota bacterium]
MERSNQSPASSRTIDICFATDFQNGTGLDPPLFVLVFFTNIVCFFRSLEAGLCEVFSVYSPVGRGELPAGV